MLMSRGAPTFAAIVLTLGLLVILATTLGITAVADAQGLTGPDPAQMEDAPDLGYRPVPNGLQIPLTSKWVRRPQWLGPQDIAYWFSTVVLTR